jgi:hypothetical protein
LAFRLIQKSYTAGILLVFSLLLVLNSTIVSGENVERTYNFNYYGYPGTIRQEIHVSIPNSAYEYYSSKRNNLSPTWDSTELVTPEVFSTVAQNIKTLIGNKTRQDEHFANAVLTMVHQIEYGDNGLKYPIETLVEDLGKCDTVSLLAVSIMKAGGLDVVLFYYEDVNHVNVGVFLPYTPHGSLWWQQPAGFWFEGKKYWIAECTPAMDWKVGDVPPLLVGETPSIISLDNTEESSLVQVSSKLFSPLNSSSISINLSSGHEINSFQAHSLKLSGSITSSRSNETVVAYVSQDGISHVVLQNMTDQSGNYSFDLESLSPGVYYVRTSWWGNSEFAGADSEILQIIVGFPSSLIQYNRGNYYLLYEGSNPVSYKLFDRTSHGDFLDFQINGTGVLLTGEFIVIKCSQTTPIQKDSEMSVELLKFLELRKDFKIMRSPVDLKSAANEQLAFFIRDNNNGNFSLNVRELTNHDISKLANKTTMIEAFSLVKDDVWYKIEVKISPDQVNIVMRDENTTLLEWINNPNEIANDELVLLLANNTDKSIVFRDLKFEPFYETAQTIEDNKNGALEPKLIAIPVVSAIILSTIIILVTKWIKIKYKKGRKFFKILILLFLKR